MKDKLKFALLSAGEANMNIAAKVDLIAELLLNNFKIKDGKLLEYADDNTALLRHTYDSNNYTDVKVYGNFDTTSMIRVAKKRTGESEKTYSLFGEHNKPSGSYTGNGISDQRTIATGSIGHIFLLTNSKNASVVLTTPSASFVFTSNGNMEFIPNAQAKSYGGNINLATTSQYLNENGVSYVYYSL